MINKILMSADFLIALLLGVCIYLSFPEGIQYDAAEGIFSTSISILSIVFSIFFAALALLISTGDNDFIRFAEKNKSYSGIIWTFKYTLSILFFALLFSIVLYISVLPNGDYYEKNLIFPRSWISIFSFVFLYSLFSTLQAIFDSVKFAEFRMRFMKLNKKNKG